MFKRLSRVFRSFFGFFISVAEDPELILEQNIRTLMAVPLQTRDQIIGIIYVDSPSVLREFTKDDLNARRRIGHRDSAMPHPIFQCQGWRV